MKYKLDNQNQNYLPITDLSKLEKISGQSITIVDMINDWVRLHVKDSHIMCRTTYQLSIPSHILIQLRINQHNLKILKKDKNMEKTASLLLKNFLLAEEIKILIEARGFLENPVMGKSEVKNTAKL